MRAYRAAKIVSMVLLAQLAVLLTVVSGLVGVVGLQENDPYEVLTGLFCLGVFGYAARIAVWKCVEISSPQSGDDEGVF